MTPPKPYYTLCIATGVEADRERESRFSLMWNMRLSFSKEVTLFVYSRAVYTLEGQSLLSYKLSIKLTL